MINFLPKVVRFSSLKENDLFTFQEDFVIFPIGLCRRTFDDPKGKAYIAYGHKNPPVSKLKHMTFADPEVIFYDIPTREREVIKIEDIEDDGSEHTDPPTSNVRT